MQKLIEYRLFSRSGIETFVHKTGTSQVGAISKAQIKSKGGTLWRQKNSDKKSHSGEKNERGDLLVPSGFVGYV